MMHFDPAAMQDDLMGSAEIVTRVLTRFVDWQEAVETQLGAAASAEDFDQMGRLAHSLRGTLAQLHASSGVALATAVELRCRQRQPVSAQMLAELRAEMATIAADVRAYLGRTGSAN